MKTILILGLNLLLTMTVFSQSIGKIGGVDDPARIGGVRIDSVKSILSISVPDNQIPAQVGDYRDGGVVFYVDETGQHGLVCAVSDQSASAEWGCPGTEISGADGTAVGTGSQNTIDIITDCSTEGTAAYICANLTENGFNDWFLPSKDELTLMFQNRSTINTTATENGGSNFDDGAYWCSTELSGFNANYAWELYFANGKWDYYRKDNNFRVRAVRVF